MIPTLHSNELITKFVYERSSIKKTFTRLHWETNKRAIIAHSCHSWKIFKNIMRSILSLRKNLMRCILNLSLVHCMSAQPVIWILYISIPFRGFLCKCNKINSKLDRAYLYGRTNLFMLVKHDHRISHNFGLSNLNLLRPTIYYYCSCKTLKTFIWPHV